MKKIDLGQSITILANIGVIVGIVFLAVEIQQTNELMASDARFNRLSLSTEVRNVLSTNGELAEIYVKVNNDEPLTQVQAYRFRMAQMRFLGIMEWVFREIPEDSRDREYAERQLMQSPGTDWLRRQVFLDSRENFDPDFVKWIEANILVH